MSHIGKSNVILCIKGHMWHRHPVLPRWPSPTPKPESPITYCHDVWNNVWQSPSISFLAECLFPPDGLWRNASVVSYGAPGPFGQYTPLNMDKQCHILHPWSCNWCYFFYWKFNPIQRIIKNHGWCYVWTNVAVTTRVRTYPVLSCARP